MKKYIDTATRDDIIRDGWSRGFHPSQIFEELGAQGLFTDIDTLYKELEKIDKEYEREFPSDIQE